MVVLPLLVRMGVVVILFGEMSVKSEFLSVVG